MKNFGKKIVLVLVSFLILAVPFLMTACEFSLEISNKDNSGEITQEENVDSETMSLDDARALMTKVCMACTGVKDANKLSPASVENYNYDEVQLDDFDSPIVVFLLQVKYALDYSEGERDYLKTNVQVGPDQYTWYYFMYKLQKKGVLFDVTLYNGNAKLSAEVCDLGNDSWTFELYYYVNYDANYDEFHGTTYLPNNKISFTGVGLSVKKYKSTIVNVDVNAYANDLISKDDLINFRNTSIDAIEHRCNHTYMDSDFSDEAVDFVNDCRSSVKDAWKPEFDETKFKDCPAIQEKANEVMNEYYNQLGD